MSKRLVAATAYMPNGGINYDTNSLALAPNQAPSMLNLRVLPHEIRTRGGSRRVSQNTPSGDPILHFHTYKEPEGNEILFGFTKSNIYKYDSINQIWIEGSGITLVDACDNIFSGTGYWTIPSGEYSPPIGTAYGVETVYNPEEEARFGFYITNNEMMQNVTTPVYIASKLFNSFQDWSGQASLHFRLLHTVSTDTMTLPALFTGVWTITDDADDTVEIPFSYTILTTGIYGWKDFHLILPAGIDYNNIKSISLRYTAGEVSFEHHIAFDNFSVGNIAFDVSNWSTTDFIDDHFGATIIAAGSNLPLPTEPEDDGTDRVLLYYDKAAGYFKNLVTRTTTQTSELTDPSGGTSPGPHTGTVAHTPVTPFAFNLLCGGFRVSDNGTGALSGDGTGTIDYDTGAWSVTWNGGITADQKIQANYLYYTTTTPLPRYVCSFNDRLVGANTYQDSLYFPWRVIWTDPADCQTFRTDSYVDLISTDTSSIVALVPQGEYLVIYREGSVSKMRYVGGTTTFAFYQIWQYGIFAGRSILNWNNVHFILAKDDIYRFDGNSFQSIATNRIRNRLFDLLNLNRIQYCFASFNDKYKEYWLWIVTNNEDYPTDVFVYSILYDSWSYFKFQPTTAIGYHYTRSGTTIDDLVGTINQQNWLLHSGLLEGTLRTPIMAMEAGDCYALDELLVQDYIVNDVGSDIEWFLITKDFTFSDMPRQDRLQRVHFEATGHEVTCGYSPKYSTDIAGFQNKIDITLTPNYDEHQYWPDSVHEHHRLSYEGVGFFALRWTQPFVVTEELD